MLLSKIIGRLHHILKTKQSDSEGEEIRPELMEGAKIKGYNTVFHST